MVIFGAGNIGRGLLGELVSAAGLRPVFVEADGELARRLVAVGKYEVRLVGQTEETRQVRDFEVLTLDDSDTLKAALANCRFVATAVGGQNLPQVAPFLASGLAERAAPLQVMICENLPHADEILARALRAQNVPAEQFVCVRAAVERMVRAAGNSLNLIGESGQTLYVDRSAWLSSLPDIPGMILCDNLESFYERKLFTNNAGHALLAYLGKLWGGQFIHEAMTVEEIRGPLEKLLQGAGAALVHLRGIEASEMDRHIESLRAWRFPNRELADTVSRVGRDPLRKLGPEERLVGLIRLLQTAKLPTEPVARAVGAALHYFDPDDQESVRLHGMIQSGGVESVLTSVCDLDKDEVPFEECLRFYTYYDKRKEYRA